MMAENTETMMSKCTLFSDNEMIIGMLEDNAMFSKLRLDDIFL